MLKIQNYLFSQNYQYKHFLLHLANHMIQKVSWTICLGININDELRWGEHIKYVLKRLLSGSYALHAVKICVSNDNMLTLYYILLNSFPVFIALGLSSMCGIYSSDHGQASQYVYLVGYLLHVLSALNSLRLNTWPDRIANTASSRQAV